MERIFEDHENLVDGLLNWTRDSQNRLMFIERIEKYALFKNPQNYLLGRKETCEMADRNKEALLEECFCGSSVSVPEMEGVLWLKEDGRKSWKKRYFLLRASGIYYVPKGKAKIQKKSQYIKYLCCDDVRTLHQWINGIRIAKVTLRCLSNNLMRAKSQSNHSSSDSGVAVSESNLSGHTRSQSQVSSIFSEAWKRGTQDDSKERKVKSVKFHTVPLCTGGTEV
ncbi:unnamed protein product [Coregonus sp. 'balchen']|nr:unnamed protein product [Coregonus sp. 'balchen']